MLAARAQHVDEVIAPALEAGRDVVCDRFSASTIAYQGYGRGLDVPALGWLSDWAAAGTTPDAVVLLAVPATVAVARRRARGAADRFEGEGDAFFARIAEGFAALAAADPQRWRVVDGTGTVEEVAARVAAAATGVLGAGPAG
jgi:dTMP kinase